MNGKWQFKRLAAKALAAAMTVGTVLGNSGSLVYASAVPRPITETPGEATQVSGISYAPSVSMVDTQAIDAAAALYSYLDGVGKSPYVLYGHQNDTHHKGGGSFEGSTSSDTKDLTGSIAAVVGIDSLSLTGAELAKPTGEKDSVDEAAAISIAAAAEGAIITMSAHMPNFAEVKEKGTDRDGDYDYSAYSSNTTTGAVMDEILPGGELNDVYNGFLDIIARYALILQDAGVPVLFRPFHENNGSWFWWGASFCDEETYKNVYRYTVEYLRDGKGVHNFLYVYSPNGPFASEEEYESRYPGDNYVDVISFDMYHDNPQAQDNWMESFAQTVALIDRLAEKHGKLSAVAETGMRVQTSLGDGHSYSGIAPAGNRRQEWFTEIENIVSPSNMAYYMVWANFDDTDNFFAPYKVNPTMGQEMSDAFIRYYNSDTSVFANGTNFYGQVTAPSKSGRGTSGYIVNPVSSSRLVKPQRAYASLSSRAESVSFVLYNEDRSVRIPVEAERVSLYHGLKYVYGAQITREMLDQLGKTVGTMELVADGQVLAVNTMIYNIAEADDDPRIVDQFEGYLGKAALLNKDWATNVGTNCSITPELTPDQKSEGDYGMAFRYHINSLSGQEGWAGMTKRLDADFSGCNALQLWITPDGRGQKLVIQLTSGGEDFEVYLSDYAATTQGGYVTIPFSAFAGKNGGTFDAANVTGFGIWCNTIGAVDVDSVMYFDDIHGVQTDLTSIAFNQERLGLPGGAAAGSGSSEGTGGGADSSGSGSESAYDGVSQGRQVIPELEHLGPALAYGQGVAPAPVENTGVTTELLAEGSYETWECRDVSWLMSGADTDYVTVEYSCTDATKGGWGILGWGATVDGQWKSGPSYTASEENPTQRATAMISIKALRRNFQIKNGAKAEAVFLNGWNGGQINRVTLTQGASIPHSPILVQDAAPDWSWVCTDIEYLRDLPADKILNLTITCADSGHKNWQIMNWGAQVDGQWVSGPVYNASYRAEHKIQVSYTIGEFLSLLGIREDSLVEYLELSVYNGGQILRLSIDDERLPSYSYHRPTGNGSGGSGSSDSGSTGSATNPYNSEYEKLVAAVAKGENTQSYDTLLGTIGGWGQSEAQDTEIVSQIKEGNFLVIQYANSGGAAPKLWPRVEGVDYRTVDAVWSNGEYAVYTYESIAKAFKNYVIPMDIEALNLAAGSAEEVEIQGVYIYTDEDSPIQDTGNFITELWAQHELGLAEYNAQYQEGDTVTVSVTFDREVSGMIGANIGGQWDQGDELTGTTITRTLTPDEGKVFVSISDFKGASYAEIKNVRVDIEGKLNYDAAVEINAPQSLGVSRTEAQDILEAAGVTDEEVGGGTKLVVTMEEEELTDEIISTLDQVPTDDGSKPVPLAAIDITMEKVEANGTSQYIHETSGKVRFVLAVPEGADPTQKFVVARIHNGEVVWLEDLDDNPNTVTIETDRFSTYVISQVDLNTDDVVSDEEIRAKGVYAYNNLSRLKDVMERAENGEDITLVFLGGSITEGFVADPRDTFCWAYRTYQWWQENFPNANIEYVNAGIGGTDSYEGVHRAETDVLAYDPDLVIVEFSVNDYRSHNQESYESLIRRLLASDESPAVVSLLLAQTDTNNSLISFSDEHKEVIDFYDIPAVDYAEVVRELVESGGWTGIGNADDLVHPNNNGHHVIYRCMEYFLDQVKNDTDNSLDGAEYGEYQLPDERMTASRFENGQILDNTADSGKIAVTEGTAEAEYFSAAQFKNGWSLSDGNDVTFTIGEEVNATSIGLIYYKLTTENAGKYDIYVDGTYATTIDSKVEGLRLQEVAEYTLLNLNLPAGEHEVTFKLNEDSAGTDFIVLGFTAASAEGEAPEGIYTFHKEDIVEDPNYPGWFREIQNFTLSEYRTEPVDIVGGVIDIEVTLESEGGFTGNLGISDPAGEGNWVSQPFDENGTAVLTITTAQPMYDSFQITIESMDAETVTVKSIQVTKAEGLTPENPTMEIDLGEYLPAWEVGYEIVLDVRMNQEVSAKIDGEEVTGTTLTRTFAPEDGTVTLEITDFNGADEVYVRSVSAALDVEEIHTFTATYNDGALEGKLSDYMENPGDFRANAETTVTVTLDREIVGQIGGNVNGGWSAGDFLEGITWTRTFVPSDDYLNIYATDLKGNDMAKVVSVTVEQEAGTEEPVEAIHTFTEAWASYEVDLETLAAKEGKTLELGQEMTVNFKLDTPTGMKLIYDNDWGTAIEIYDALEEHSFTFTPNSSLKILIQLTDMVGKSEINLIGVEVTQEEELADPIATFRADWSDNTAYATLNLSDYAETDLDLNRDVEVTLTLDTATGVKIAYNSWAGNYTNQTAQKVHTTSFVPEEDSIVIQVTDMAGKSEIHLIGVEVTQEEELADPIATFTADWTDNTAYETVNLSEYAETELDLTRVVEVTITLDTATGVKIAYNNWGGDYTNQTAKEVHTTSFVPVVDSIAIQVTDMADQEEINLLNIQVEQEPAEEPQLPVIQNQLPEIPELVKEELPEEEQLPENTSEPTETEEPEVTGDEAEDTETTTPEDTESEETQTPEEDTAEEDTTVEEEVPGDETAGEDSETEGDETAEDTEEEAGEIDGEETDDTETEGGLEDETAGEGQTEEAEEAGEGTETEEGQAGTGESGQDDTEETTEGSEPSEDPETDDSETETTGGETGTGEDSSQTSGGTEESGNSEQEGGKDEESDSSNTPDAPASDTGSASGAGQEGSGKEDEDTTE